MLDDPTLPLTDGVVSAAETPEARDAWGSFRLIARVGHGGFGEVYRAWDPNLEREVALKLLLPRRTGAAESESEGERQYQSVLREARALASVRHPNIVPVYGIDRHDGRTGFWMDFVRGKTLAALLATQGPFGYREATLIGLDVTRALSAVHRAGLLHRDIKAENVMREEGGRILLMDLGLSSLRHDQTHSSGTPNYMAPELWRGEPATVESDIYAMGVLLYYLVSGEHPVRLGGLSVKEAVEAIVKRRPLMDVRADLPESFLRTVSRAMETDPAKRFGSAGQLAAALAECLGTAAPVVKKLWWSTGKLGIAAAVLVSLGAVVLATPAGRRMLHLEREPVIAEGTAPGAGSASTREQYEHAEALLQKSYKDSNVTEAINELQQVLHEDPTFALAQAALGSAYFVQYKSSHDSKQLDLAKAATASAFKMEPELAPAFITRARIEASAGQTDLALPDAQKAVKLEPRSAAAFGALAEAYDALGRRDDAITAVKHAIDLEPENTMWLVRLGNYNLEVGNLQEAASQWQQAIKIDPENVFALYDLGVANMRLDKLDEARQDFEGVLKFGPDADSYRTLGTVLQLQGRFGDAIQMDKKSISLDRANFESWANLGSAYTWNGPKREEAKSAYSEAIKLAEEQRLKRPEDADLLAEIADFYASIGESTKSMPLARKALALAPDNLNVIYLSGESYELLGERKMAIPLIAKSVASGFRSNAFERSPYLASLRNDPEFRSALTEAKNTFAMDTAKKIN